MFLELHSIASFPGGSKEFISPMKLCVKISVAVLMFISFSGVRALILDLIPKDLEITSYKILNHLKKLTTLSDIFWSRFQQQFTTL